MQQHFGCSQRLYMLMSHSLACVGFCLRCYRIIFPFFRLLLLLLLYIVYVFGELESENDPEIGQTQPQWKRPSETIVIIKW